MLFASDVKAIHQNTLAVLHKLAKERKEHRDAICCVAAQGLMSREESTQSKIVKLIQMYGETASTTLKEVLSIYTETMLANTKKDLKAYLGNNEPEDSASFTYEPILPIIREDNRIQEITSTEDLIFLASQVLDVNEIYHFDLLLGALVEWTATGSKNKSLNGPLSSNVLQIADKRREFPKRYIRPANGHLPP